MTLPELLETRDKIIANRKRIPKRLYTFGLGRLQYEIYKRRTTTKSGLYVPYDKNRTEDL